MSITASAVAVLTAAEVLMQYKPMWTSPSRPNCVPNATKVLVYRHKSTSLCMERDEAWHQLITGYRSFGNQETVPFAHVSPATQFVQVRTLGERDIIVVLI
jgi:hypothetical protein